MIPRFDFRQFLKTVPTQPGVYCMQDAQGRILYVGKANNLKQRLAHYGYQQTKHSDSHSKPAPTTKTAALVAAIAVITITVTHTETEALLLEYNTIQQHKPRYNVLLREEGDYPFIVLTSGKHPRLIYHRGSKRTAGEYFGPFPNPQAVRETLALLQRLFPLRQCEDSVYRNRTRPCLQYQIGRCLGPCIPGLVSESTYQQQVDCARLFLQGKDQQVLSTLVARMAVASQTLQFETAARLRDQIQAIRQVLEKQFVTNSRHQAADAISIVQQAGVVCVQVLMLRHGKLLGSRSYFPIVPLDRTLSEIAQTFITLYYLPSQRAIVLPDQIWLDVPLPDSRPLARTLSAILQQPLVIYPQPRGDRARYLQLAHTNAVAALQSRVAQRSTQQQRLKALQQLLALPPLERLECFDISHTLGEKMVASCVVFNAGSPLKAEYRRYTITAVTPGDDCAAIAQVLQRRYTPPLDPEKIPCVVLIDGGKGQLNAAQAVFNGLINRWGERPPPRLLAIAKGPGRKPGLETLFLTTDTQGCQLSATDPALHLLQHLRDEAHRHALMGHRQQRAKGRRTSRLQQIPGIGPKRRQALLLYLGGLQPLLKASVEEIAAVPMISRRLAEKIYTALQGEIAL
ncbi:excinuclease ABC subunit UvrC [unidentified bacterial endosymbiont]|uniref:excinuclease ABC subunit UvrC n=1 Tax=unidentified bacterial endosymbiont TaxID=2355 RepID=UPI00209D4FDF|nr:excinuclease ABC subunit UvrC [unidentified bacterial endosymbiont]